MDNVILIGFMGSGKTTIGKVLAQQLEMDFLDTDELIEKEEGKTIREIIKNDGEEKFRILENNLLKNMRLTNTVLSTGGGMPCFFENMRLLKKLGRTIYLETSVFDLEKRLRKNFENRPLLTNDLNNIISLFKVREPVYLQADIKLVNDKTIDEVLTELVPLLRLSR